MEFEFPDPDKPLDGRWTQPLDRVADLVRGNPRYQFFDRADFMIMARILRKSRPDIVEYKHVHTRAYLHLDDTSTAYRYVPPGDSAKHDGRYVVHRSLEAALDVLGVWQLPWMKPGLEGYRYGYDWNGRWMLHPDVIPYSLNPDLGDAWNDHDDDCGLDVCSEMYRQAGARVQDPDEEHRSLKLLPPIS